MRAERLNEQIAWHSDADIAHYYSLWASNTQSVLPILWWRLAAGALFLENMHSLFADINHWVENRLTKAHCNKIRSLTCVPEMPSIRCAPNHWKRASCRGYYTTQCSVSMVRVYVGAWLSIPFPDWQPWEGCHSFYRQRQKLITYKLQCIYGNFT